MYELKLYVVGQTLASVDVINKLRALLEDEFKDQYSLEIIDIIKNPQLAENDKILATPTLVKVLPPPIRRIVGDLSDRKKVLIGLDSVADIIK